MADDQDKLFQNQLQKKHLSILTGTSNDAEKYAAGICGSRPKHRSGPSLIRMKFCLCRPSIHTGRRSFRHRLLIFVAWMSKVAWTFDSVASVYRAVRIQIYHYKGCSINKSQNNIILLIFKIWKFQKNLFCREFSCGHIVEFLWRWRHYCDVTCT